MKISFTGIGDQYVTFAAGTGAEQGKPCKLSASGEAVPCAKNDVFCGVICDVRGGAAGVKLGGYVELPCSGTLPAPGYVKLDADGAGGVKKSDTGREYLVVLAEAGTVGFFLSF